MESVDKPFGMIVGRMMHAMFRVLRNRTNEQTEAKLTIEQFGLLFAISKQKNDIIQKDVAGMMGKDKSAILRMIYSLEKKGLVLRVVDSNDCRKSNVLVSEKGQIAIAQHLKIESELSKELIGGLSQSDLDTFYKVIGHIRCKAEMMIANS